MSARQLIVLAVAFVAAIGALLIMRNMGNRATPEPAQVTVAATEQVLVLAHDVPRGAALQSSDLEWRPFTHESVSENFITISASPSAQSEFAGAVTRRDFVVGEPLIANAVIQPEGRGFMAAQLPPGYRAVALEIEPQTSAGGFIQPNDRVDVVMTVKVSDDEVRSDLILEDVLVLALDDQVSTQTSGDAPAQIEASIAVLELSAGDAQILSTAQRRGEVALVLRGVETETPGMRAASASRGGLNQRAQSVRVHSFGTVKN